MVMGRRKNATGELDDARLLALIGGCYVSWRWRAAALHNHALGVFSGRLLAGEGLPVPSDVPAPGSEPVMPPNYVGFAMLLAWTNVAVAVRVRALDRG